MDQSYCFFGRKNNTLILYGLHGFEFHFDSLSARNYILNVYQSAPPQVNQKWITDVISILFFISFRKLK